MTFINLTPHVVRLNDGTEFHPSGTVARVATEYKLTAPEDCQICDETHGGCEGCPLQNHSVDFYEAKFGEIIGLPKSKIGVFYIVSAMVKQASDRMDLISPSTGHSDCIRKDGQIFSVPGFIL